MSKFTLWNSVVSFLSNSFCENCDYDLNSGMSYSLIFILLDRNSIMKDVCIDFCKPAVYGNSVDFLKYNKDHDDVLIKNKILGRNNDKYGWITYSGKDDDWCEFQIDNNQQAIKDYLLELFMDMRSTDSIIAHYEYEF